MPSAVPHAAPTAAPRAAQGASPGLLALEGGHVLSGALHGSRLPAEGDLVFTTAGTGWGEILTDPSYAGQMVVLTHPMAGNYRIARSELESTRVHARGLVVTRLVEPPPGPGVSLDELLTDGGIPAISGIDTRALTLLLRNGAARRATIVPAEVGEAEAIERARISPTWESVDHVAAVATREPFRIAPVGERRARAVLVDYGVKRSLLAALAGRGIEVSASRRTPRPRMSPPRLRTSSCCPPARATRRGWRVRSRRFERWRRPRSRAGRRSSASAWATSCSAWPRARRPGAGSRPPRGNHAVLEAATGGSTSAPTTTRSRSSTGRRWQRPATASAIAT